MPSCIAKLRLGMHGKHMVDHCHPARCGRKRSCLDLPGGCCRWCVLRCTPCRLMKINPQFFGFQQEGVAMNPQAAGRLGAVALDRLQHG